MLLSESVLTGQRVYVNCTTAVTVDTLSFIHFGIEVTVLAPTIHISNDISQSDLPRLSTTARLIASEQLIMERASQVVADFVYVGAPVVFIQGTITAVHLFGSTCCSKRIDAPTNCSLTCVATTLVLCCACTCNRITHGCNCTVHQHACMQV